ncbi:Dihydroorotate dehydrogenase (quinone) [Vibrio cholerae]|nr:Dihydroorotate dehydrogenase (quinone) [Vibrio cholerae]
MLYRLARAGFFQLDAEKAHDLAISNFKRFTGTPFDLFYRQQLPHRPSSMHGLNL